MIEDDRIGSTLSQLETIATDELHWLTDTVDVFCWSQLASVVAAEGSSASELRTEAVLSAHLSAAFLDRKVFRPARELPWLLVTGQGVEAELDALAAMEAVPSDPTAAKIQGLMKVGYNRAALVEAVELLRDIRWSSATVEQGHRSASIIGQLHATMGSDMLMMRSYIHMMKPLVTAEKARKSVTVALKRIARSEDRQPKHITGRQFFLKAMFGEAMAALPAGAKLHRATSKSIMKEHSCLYKQMPSPERNGLEHRAKLARASSMEAIQEDIHHCQALVSLDDTRAREEELQLGK